jgi:hypothetical protein
MFLTLVARAYEKYACAIRVQYMYRQTPAIIAYLVNVVYPQFSVEYMTTNDITPRLQASLQREHAVVYYTAVCTSQTCCRRSRSLIWTLYHHAGQDYLNR